MANHVYFNITSDNPMENYLKRVPWDKLGECRWTSRYHGDLQFDNVIYDGEKFCLIDWRHDFGGNETWGDAYYDVAKLYGGTLINYSLMKSPKNISLTASKEEVDFFYNHNDTLIQFRPLLEEWIKCWFDFEKVRLLTGLIWLNMSPLHEQPFSDMLFYKAKEMLANVLD